MKFQPRVGLTWDPFKTGKTIIRSAYAIISDQPTLGYVTGLASNPPYAFPISFSPSATTPFVTFANAYNAPAASCHRPPSPAIIRMPTSRSGSSNAQRLKNDSTG